MAKKASKATKTSGRATKKSPHRGKAKKAAKTPAVRRSSGLPAARKRRKQPTAAKPQGVRRAGVAGLAASPATIDVTMTIDFGKGAPNDIQSIRRIDTTDLSGSRASVSRGKHTVGWDVFSPTVQPIGFSVTIVEDATGKKLFERKEQQTGAEGEGAGAGSFTV